MKFYNMGLFSYLYDVCYYMTHILTVYSTPNAITSFYDTSLNVKDATGNDVQLSNYIGKVIFIK